MWIRYGLRWGSTNRRIIPASRTCRRKLYWEYIKQCTRGCPIQFRLAKTEEANMKFIYFVALAHQEIHLRYIHRVFGGSVINYSCGILEEDFPDHIFAEDSEDSVWFFADIYPALHARIKGKQIYVGHGLSLKRFMLPWRVITINEQIDAVFSTGQLHEDRCIEAGVLPELIVPIGWTTVFQMPTTEVKPNAVLISSAHWLNWNVHSHLVKILKSFPESFDGYLTIHPETPQDSKDLLFDIVESKDNLTLLHTQDDLLKAQAMCSYAVGSLSSAYVPTWFLKRPVIIVGEEQEFVSRVSQRDPWIKIKREMNCPLFDRIIAETQTLIPPQLLDEDVFSCSQFTQSALEMFYPWNWDEKETVVRLRQAVEHVVQASSR